MARDGACYGFTVPARLDVFTGLFLFLYFVHIASLNSCICLDWTYSVLDSRIASCIQLLLWLFATACLFFLMESIDAELYMPVCFMVGMTYAVYNRSLMSILSTLLPIIHLLNDQLIIPLICARRKSVQFRRAALVLKRSALRF